jgi:hypothetical protein
MATPREIRYRVLYLLVGVVLTIVTVATLALVTPWWWGVIPGFLAFGWWNTLIRLLVERIFATSDDAFGSRPD